MGLANDNWYGYLQKWIYEMDITWMEKTVASPFWTGMTLFTIAERGKRGEQRRHLLEEKMYQAPRRVAFKGQVFSAPMDWDRLLEQLFDPDSQPTHITLPHTGGVLASKVRIFVSSGLVDLNKYIRQATVRRNVVVQLIRMFKDAGHMDYQHLNMDDVKTRSRDLADTDEPSIPL